MNNTNINGLTRKSSLSSHVTQQLKKENPDSAMPLYFDLDFLSAFPVQPFPLVMSSEAEMRITF